MRRKKITPEQELEICSRYIAGESSIALGKEYKVTNNTILKYLKRNEVARRTRNETQMGKSKIAPAKQQDIINRYSQGERSKALAVEYKVSHGTILNILRKAGTTNDFSPLARHRTKMQAIFEKWGDCICERYVEGYTAILLGKIFALSPIQILKYLKSQGIEVRPSRVEIQKAMKGTEELRMINSAQNQGIKLEDWKGYTRPFWQRWKDSQEYHDWRTIVLARDKTTCQWCKKKRGLKNKMECHHIYRKSQYFHLALDANNGITLCHNCHISIRGKEDSWIEIFLALINSPLQGQVITPQPFVMTEERNSFGNWEQAPTITGHIVQEPI